MDNLPPSNFRSTIFWVRLGAFVLFSLALFHLASCGGGSDSHQPPPMVITPPPTSPPPLTRPPDLVIASNSVSDDTLTTGQRFTLFVTVRNQGTSGADTTTLRYKRATYLPIIKSDSDVGTDSVRSLGPSESSNESIILTAPLTAGIYHYGACVDSVSGESNTENNCSGDGGVRVTVRSVSLPPPTGTTSLLRFRISDGCNDGYDMDYRFFEITGNRKTGVWPVDNLVWTTRSLGTVHTHTLSCKVGTNVCFGARRRKSNPISYWGIGIDGNQSCSDCCYSCPSSGQVTTNVENLIC